MGLGLASFGGGAVAGAVGAALGSPVQGISNAAYFNDEYSAKQWGTDVLSDVVPGGFTAQFPEYTDLTRGARYTGLRW